ncbi:TPA: hypothetical protein R1B11_003378 [Klebsiella pneumoniae]|uniref:hypothetical protein n=1 Tax=Klebsiella pneumoniae TaxID=573 RepID=UPI00094B68A8|nr:hypothetical protein [Klebsiella pneumoniae]EMF2455895.1 hypothetical protein [Klebsiella pneumoniae]MBZ1877132.1 hypothetical protein [Klebsiella pneumoniae]MEA4519631.1 hypothetical protein [Klebsiella pneumoniae]OLL62901.1 hypothetical protein BSK25_13960 [Klebsiella pneumoniae]OUH50069.1 hypothetical protein AZ027_001334 [Klebsiella pneumoniae]
MTDITELALITIKNQIKSFDTVVLRENEALALVEALEKAQQRIGKLEKKLTDHKRMNQEMAKAMLTPNDSDAAGMEIAALRQRIAELESRTVKLPEPFKLAKSSSVLTYYYADEVDAALTAAGIKVEAE